MTLSTKNSSIIYDLKTTLTTRREELGLSVKELGKKAGVSYTVIYDFEIRGIIPKIETLFKLTEVLNLDLYITLGGYTPVKEKSPLEEIKENLFILGLNNNATKEIVHFIEFKLQQEEL